MSRVPTVLAVLAGLPLLALTVLSTTPVVPPIVPPVLVGVGVAIAGFGGFTRHGRVHLVGLVAMLAGTALAGLTLSWLEVFLGALGTVLAVASLTLALELPREGSHAKLVPVTLMLASGAAVTGVALAYLGAELGGGGLDARAGVAAWAVLVVAIGWALVRRAVRGSPS